MQRSGPAALDRRQFCLTPHPPQRVELARCKVSCDIYCLRTYIEISGERHRGPACNARHAVRRCTTMRATARHAARHGLSAVHDATTSIPRARVSVRGAAWTCSTRPTRRWQVSLKASGGRSASCCVISLILRRCPPGLIRRSFRKSSAPTRPVRRRPSDHTTATSRATLATGY